MAQGRNGHVCAGGANYKGGICRRRVYKKVRQPGASGRNLLDMARDIPEQWRPLLDAKSIGSYRALSARAGVSVATVIRLLNNEGAPEPPTVEAVAQALDVEPNLVLELAGSTARDYGPVDWPVESRWLTPRQREAVVGVIRSMVEPETVGGTGKSGVKKPPRPPSLADVSDITRRGTDDLASDIAAGKKAARKRGQAKGERWVGGDT